MDTNRPSTEVMNDLASHNGWRYIEAWMDERKEECKQRLLNAKTMDEVLKVQAQYETFQNITCKVKSLCEKDQK